MSILQGRDLGGYVSEAARAVADQVKLPPGYHIEWSGQFEYLQRAAAKLRVVIPATLLLIFVLLYLNFGRLTETLIVMLSVPFALVGGAWLMWWLGYNMSVAVAVGFIALAGVAAETGVVMLIYLDHALKERARALPAGRPQLDAAMICARDHRRRRRARAPEDDDRGRHHGRSSADPLERGRGLGSDAAHRRADGGRHAVLDLPHPHRHSGDLCPGQGLAPAAHRYRACHGRAGLSRSRAERSAR